MYSLWYSGHYAVVLNSLTKTLSTLAKDPFTGFERLLLVVELKVTHSWITKEIEFDNC